MYAALPWLLGSAVVLVWPPASSVGQAGPAESHVPAFLWAGFWVNHCSELSITAVARLVLMRRRGSMWQQGWPLLLASCACARVASLGGVWGEKIALENNCFASGSDER